MLDYRIYLYYGATYGIGEVDILNSFLQYFRCLYRTAVQGRIIMVFQWTDLYSHHRFGRFKFENKLSRRRASGF